MLPLLACLRRPVISLVCNLLHPCNLEVFRHRAGHHPYDQPCSGASYYCGQPVLGASAPPGCVEVAWRSPRAGTAPRESTATAKASRTCPHLEREPANPRVARPMCAHSTLTSRRTKRSLHACALCRRVLRYRVHARRPGAAASSKSSPRHCPSSGARLLRLLRAALGRVRYS